MLQVLVGAGFAAVLWVGGRKILAGELTVARYVEFNLYLMELVWPAIALGWVVNLWQRGSASWNRMVELWGRRAAPRGERRRPAASGDARVPGPHLLLRRRPSRPARRLPHRGARDDGRRSSGARAPGSRPS